MRILKICKYPPIEGGESSKNYWKIRGLAKSGIKVGVVTNSYEVEDNYRCNLNLENQKEYIPENVELLNTYSFNKPQFIPFFNPYTIKLINQGILYLDKYDVDVMEGSYLLPYGVAASYLSMLFEKPLVLSHAGSDITRLMEYNQYSTILNRILIKADAIITYPGGKNFFVNKGVKGNKIKEIKHAVDTNNFNPDTNSTDLKKVFNIDEKHFLFTHFGKLNPNKGIYELVRAAESIDEDFRILFIGSGEGLIKFREFVNKSKTCKKIFIKNFVAPWQVPGIMKSSDCMLSVETKFGVSVHAPVICKESIATGKPCLVSGEINVYSKHRNYPGSVLFEPSNEKEYGKVLKNIIKNKGNLSKKAKEGSKVLKEENSFENYIEKNINVYENLIR